MQFQQHDKQIIAIILTQLPILRILNIQQYNIHGIIEIWSKVWENKTKIRQRGTSTKPEINDIIIVDAFDFMYTSINCTHSFIHVHIHDNIEIILKGHLCVALPNHVYYQLKKFCSIME